MDINIPRLPYYTLEEIEKYTGISPEQIVRHCKVNDIDVHVEINSSPSASIMGFDVNSDMDFFEIKAVVDFMNRWLASHKCRKVKFGLSNFEIKDIPLSQTQDRIFCEISGVWCVDSGKQRALSLSRLMSGQTGIHSYIILKAHDDREAENFAEDVITISVKVHNLENYQVCLTSPNMERLLAVTGKLLSEEGKANAIKPEEIEEFEKCRKSCINLIFDLTEELTVSCEYQGTWSAEETLAYIQKLATKAGVIKKKNGKFSGITNLMRMTGIKKDDTVRRILRLAFR